MLSSSARRIVVARLLNIERIIKESSGGRAAPAIDGRIVNVIGPVGGVLLYLPTYRPPSSLPPRGASACGLEGDDQPKDTSYLYL